MPSPDTAAASLKQEADAHLKSGSIEEASRCYAEACRLNPTDAGAWVMLGNLQTRRGAVGQAEAAYRRAISVDPQRGEAHQFLGNLLGAQGRYDEATACYRRALQIKPHSLPAHVNLGTVLTLRGQLDDAITVFRSALDHEPGSRKAALGLAHVYEKQGHIEQAFAHLEPFLQESPVEADATLIFAALAPSLGRSEEAAALIEGVLNHKERPLTDEQRAGLHFRLGRLRDADGRYDAAFEQFKLGNDLKARTRQFDPQAHARYVDAVIAAYSPALMANAPRAAHGSDRPVFIIGMPRSGTSLVEQILASHPAVFGAGELDIVQRISLDLPNAIDADMPYPQCIASMTSAQCDRLSALYLRYIDERAPSSAIRVTDKMPANFLHLGLIALLFPNARIIHCVRDPMDTCLSCYFQNFGPANAYTYDLFHLGQFFQQYTRLMDHWREVLGISMMEVRYEDLVENQEVVSRALVEFCGLPWDEQCLHFYNTNRAVATASYEQVRRPVYSGSVQRWRHYIDHIGPLRSALGGDMVGNDVGEPPAPAMGRDDAAAELEHVVQTRPSALAYYNLANLYASQQRLDEAVDHYRRALGLEPARPEIYNNLANALRYQGNLSSAEAAYRKALELGPDHPMAHEGHTNLGNTLLLLGRLDEAAECFFRALELAPGFQRASVGMAEVLDKRGKFEQAYERIRHLVEGGLADGDTALVFASLCRPLGRRDEAIDLIQRLLRDTPRRAMDGYVRTALHFALGRLLDSAGRYEEAFSHFQHGNELADRRFDPQAHANRIEALSAVYTKAFLESAPRSAERSERPVFIVGMPRSGTSLVEQILACHPAVFGAGELYEIDRIIAEIAAEGPYPRCIEAFGAERLGQLARRYLDHLDDVAGTQAVRVTDKMPGNFLHLGLITLLFPGARIIHCVRDPLDTCLSCYFRHFAEDQSYAYDLAHLGFYYRCYRSLMDHWREVIDLPVLEVRYEELVADQEAVSRAIVDFCSLDWDERCLRFYETPRTVSTASYDQVRQPMYQHSVERWRRYDRHLDPLRRALTEEKTT